MKKIFLIISMFAALSLGAQTTNTALNAQIDAQITNATGVGSISKGIVGNNLKDIVAYVVQVITTVESRTVNGHPLTGNVTITKSDVGLGNVDNTSDANKPISTATQTALDNKQALLVSGTNIKTVSGQGLLGAGDLSITAQNTFDADGYVNKPGGTVSIKGATTKIDSYGESYVEATDAITLSSDLGPFFAMTSTGFFAGYGTGQNFLINGANGARYNQNVFATPANLTDRTLADKGYVDSKARPYKVYTAIMYQDGTDDPTVTVLENTLSAPIVWARTGVGTYSGTLVGAFVVDKTFLPKPNQPLSSAEVGIHRVSSDVVSIETSVSLSYTDSILNRAYIEIRVYN